ncbi:hypothetical protein AALA69_00580 [Eggerthellaceae bacterium 24-137]
MRRVICHLIARCGRIALAVVLTAAVILTVGAPVWPSAADPQTFEARAWADNLDNAAVPTDDTGVVDPSAAQPEEGPDAEQGAAERPAAGAEADEGDASGAAAAGDGLAEGDAEGAEAGGEQAAEGAVDEDAQAAESETPPIIPDPVFGTGTNENNLMNPQQKPDSSFIYDTSIKSLQEADPYLNDQTVQVTGEVVGDRIKAEFDPGFCWIVLQSNDGQYTEVPVFLDQTLTEAIDTYGAYGRKGTTLQVRGTFHLACPDHEGLTDLHADTVNVVSRGYEADQKLDPSAFVPGAVLTAAGLVMLLVFRQMREGQR